MKSLGRKGSGERRRAGAAKSSRCSQRARRAAPHGKGASLVAGRSRHDSGKILEPQQFDEGAPMAKPWAPQYVAKPTTSSGFLHETDPLQIPDESRDCWKKEGHPHRRMPFRVAGFTSRNATRYRPYVHTGMFRKGPLAYLSPAGAGPIPRASSSVRQSSEPSHVRVASFQAHPSLQVNFNPFSVFSTITSKPAFEEAEVDCGCIVHALIPMTRSTERQANTAFSEERFSMGPSS